MKAEVTKHEGKILMDYIRENEISKKEICEKLNITVPMLSYHCRKEIFSGTFKAKLMAIGINLFEREKPGSESPLDYISELEEEVKLLTQIVAVQKQFITHITHNCKHGTCLNFVFENRKS